MKRAMMLAVLLLGACTNESGARRVLESEGYTQLEFKGYSWLGCGGGDTFKNAFQATTRAGRRVNLTVCCGWMKNCTVRIEP